MESAIRLALLCALCPFVQSMSKAYEDCRKTQCVSEETFGMDGTHGGSPCEAMTTATFRKKLNSLMSCSGDYCVRGSYKCEEGKTSSCYHVEHIIDEQGPEFASHASGSKSGKTCQGKPCPPSIKNIAANYVMAWGRWNSGLASEYAKTEHQQVDAEKDASHEKRMTRSAYDKMIKEKEAIYTKPRVDKARRMIRECAKLGKDEV